MKFTLGPHSVGWQTWRVNLSRKQLAILVGVLCAVLVAARFIGRRKPLEGGEAGAVAVFGDNWFKRQPRFATSERLTAGAGVPRCAHYGETKRR